MATPILGTSDYETTGLQSPFRLYLLEAVDINNGNQFWPRSVPLVSPPVQWGLAVDHEGRIFIALKDGQVMGFGKKEVYEK